MKNGKWVNKDRSLKDKNLDYKLIDVSVSISKQNLITIILNKEDEIKVLRKNIKIPNPKPTQTIEIVVLSKNIEKIDHENISLNKIPSQFVIQVKALQNKNSKIMEYTYKIVEMQKYVVQQAQIDFILPYFPEVLANYSSNIESIGHELYEQVSLIQIQGD